MSNPWQVLGVERGASKEQVWQAFGACFSDLFSVPRSKTASFRISRSDKLTEHLQSSTTQTCALRKAGLRQS